MTETKTINKEIIEGKNIAKIEKQSQAMKDIKINGQGLFTSETMEQAYTLARAFAASKMLPKEYHDDPQKVMAAMQYAHELGLKPLTAMREMTIVHGTPSIFGSLPLAIVKASDVLEYMEEFLIDKDGNEISRENKNLHVPPFGAVCIVKRKNMPKQHESVYTMDDAKLAGLLIKDNWKKHPKYMLKYRARSSALKDVFPDCLGGISIAEYDYDVIPGDVETEKNYIDPEVQNHIDKIKDLFDVLKINHSQQMVYINKYDGHGRLENINIAGLEKLYDELCNIKPKSIISMEE